MMRALISAVITACLAVSMSGGQEASYLEKIRAKSAAWEEQSMYVQGTVKTRSSFASKSRTVVDTFTKVFKQSTNGASLIQLHEREGGSEKALRTASAFNSKYGFTAGEQPKGWIMRELNVGKPQEVKDAVFQARPAISNAIEAGYPFGKAADKYFKIKKTETRREQDQEVFLVQYETELKDSSLDRVVKSTKGTMKFRVEPDLALISNEAEITVFDKSVRRTAGKSTIDYDGKLGDFPRPVKLTMKNATTVDNGESSTSETEIIFDLHYDANVPETEFTLSAFGLPEPKGITWNRPARRWIWYGVIGITLVLFGAWMLRRRAAKSHPDPAVS